MNDNDFQILFEWWEGLENDRGGRAELRRTKSPEEVVFCSAYHRLYNRLHWSGKDRDKLASIAGLAAHVKRNIDSASLAEQMAEPKSGKNPAISGLRFRRILAIDDRSELYIAMIRVIRMLGGNVNLRSLAESVYLWNTETKKRWAYKYWEKPPTEKQTGGSK